MSAVRATLVRCSMGEGGRPGRWRERCAYRPPVRPRALLPRQVAANGPTTEAAAAHARGRASEREGDHIKAPLWRAPKEEGVREGRVTHPCIPTLI